MVPNLSSERIVFNWRNIYFWQIDVNSFGVLLLEICVGEMPDVENWQRDISRVKTPYLKILFRDVCIPHSKRDVICKE